MPVGLRYRLSFLLLAGCIGLCGYGGLQWHQLPHYSEDDLRASTELNLQIDLARQGKQGNLPSEQMESLRREVRSEIDGEIQLERRHALNWLVAGLALLAVAGGNVALLRLLR